MARFLATYFGNREVKNTILTIVLLILSVAVYMHTRPIKMREIIEVTVMKNEDNIKSIHQPRHITSDKKFYIDQIIFRTIGKQFFHYALGDIGYDKDYFIDLKTSFTVKRSSNYQFEIGSDDGFALYIDNQLICEFVHGRPYTKTTCDITLTVGPHQLKLNYFQGYGNVGLSAKYKNENDKSLSYIGSDTDNLTFSLYQDKS